MLDYCPNCFFFSVHVQVWHVCVCFKLFLDRHYLQRKSWCELSCIYISRGDEAQLLILLDIMMAPSVILTLSSIRNLLMNICFLWLTVDMWRFVTACLSSVACVDSTLPFVPWTEQPRFVENCTCGSKSLLLQWGGCSGTQLDLRNIAVKISSMIITSSPRSTKPVIETSSASWAPAITSTSDVGLMSLPTTLEIALIRLG